MLLIFVSAIVIFKMGQYSTKTYAASTKSIASSSSASQTSSQDDYNLSVDSSTSSSSIDSSSDPETENNTASIGNASSSEVTGGTASITSRASNSPSNTDTQSSSSSSKISSAGPVSSSVISPTNNSSASHSGSNNTAKTVKVTGVSIPGSVNLEAGTNESLTAAITPSNASDQTLTWYSDDSSIASVSDGTVYGIKEGSTKITVKTRDGGHTGSCIVTVTPSSASSGSSGGHSSPTTINATGVTLNKNSLSLYKGASESLTATVTPANSTNKNVSWASSNPNVAYVDSNGKVAGLSNGSAIITVKTASGGYTATCKVTVAVSVSGISLNKSSVTLIKGTTEKLTASVNSDATNKSILWSSNNSNVATVNDGTVIAVNAGTTTITASSADGNYKYHCMVTVIAPESEIALDKSAVMLMQGIQEKINTTVAVKDSGNQLVTWTSANSSVATVDDGNITAVSGGTTVVTAHYGSYSANCAVTVIDASTEISLDKNVLSMVKGDFAQLTANVAVKDSGSQTVTWSSDNSNIINVDSTGSLYAVSGGTAIVTAHYGPYIAQCKITVTAHDTGVNLNQSDLRLKRGGKYTLIPTIEPQDATNQSVTWSSSDQNIVTVDDQGNITAVGAGTATVTVTTADGGYSSSCTVTVDPIQYNVTAKYQNGYVDGTGTFDENSTVTITAVPYTGYHFVQWEDENGTVIGTDSAYTISTLTANKNLTAIFAIDQLTVTATAGTNGTVTGSGTYDYGSTVTLTATPDAHYHFTGWSDGVTTASRTITVTQNVNVTASFAIDQFTVTATAGTNGTVTGSGTYDYGSTVTLTATPDAHYHFTGWSDGVTTASRTITATQNVKVTANFAIDQFTVTATAGANGTVTGSGTYAYGSNVTLTAMPGTHYHFAGWSDGVTTTSRTITATQNVNVAASFAIDTFTVTATAVANGTVTGGGTYAYGSNVTLTAVPNTGYVFTSWSDGDTSSSKTVNVAGNINLAASFVVKYTIENLEPSGSFVSDGSFAFTAEYKNEVSCQSFRVAKIHFAVPVTLTEGQVFSTIKNFKASYVVAGGSAYRAVYFSWLDSNNSILGQGYLESQPNQNPFSTDFNYVATKSGVYSDLYLYICFNSYAESKNPNTVECSYQVQATIPAGSIYINGDQMTYAQITNG